jgi:hypothetical protein
MLSPRLLLVLSLGASLVASPTTAKGVRVKARWVIVLLAVGVALDLLISGAIIYQNRQIQQNASESHILKVAAYESCLRNNTQNAADLVRWDKVLNLVDTMPENPQTVTFVNGVREANRVADHPVDCGPPVQ